MKEIINIYKSNKIAIENYIHAIVTSLPGDYMDSADKVLKKYNFIQLMYEVDKEYRQTSPIVCRQDKKREGIGSDKSHYFTRFKLDKKGLFISNPYIHYRTGKASISVVIADSDMYKIFDINLIQLLEHLKMIEHNTPYERFKKVI